MYKKIVHMTLVKSAPKKVLAKKLISQLKKVLKNLFFEHNFLRCTFYLGHMYILEIRMKRRFFDTPFDLTREKSFNLIVGSKCTFYELKSQKMQATTRYFGKRFFINR
jgi:hypothetical protein